MTKHHTPEEMRLCANFLDEMKVNHKVIKDALRITAAMLRDIADADEKDREDAERYRWLKRQKSPQEILAYIMFTKDVDKAVDTAIEQEKQS
jgi:hypothetical protein